MKKILNILFIFILGFIFITKVNASTVTWEDISEDLKLYIEEDYDATVTKTNSNFKATINGYEFDEDITVNDYTLELNYQNNVISLVAKDISGYNEEKKFYSTLLDSELLLYGVIEIINSYYEDSEFDFEESLENNTLSRYGIEFQYKELEELETIDITKFTINLNTFEAAVTGKVSVQPDTPPEKEEVKPDEKPEVDGTIPDTDKTTTGRDPITEDENATNPGTGDSTIYIVLAFLVLCIGLIIYKFKSLDNYNSL